MEDLLANPIALGLILISSFIGFWMFKSLPIKEGSDKPYTPNIDDLPEDIEDSEKNDTSLDTENIDTKEPEKLPEEPYENIYKDIYLLTNEEILEKLHKLCEPLESIRLEVKQKLKDWMPDKEKVEYLFMLNRIEDTFETLDNHRLLNIVNGYSKPYSFGMEDEDEDEEEYGFHHYLTSHLMSLDFKTIYHSGFTQEYFDEGKSQLKYVQKYYEIYININQVLMEIFWTSFGINEDKFAVCKFFENEIYDRYNDYGDYKSDEIKMSAEKRWESYQKTYFYAKDNVRRAANIFLRFNEERNLLINGSNNISEDNLIGINEKGFVYFIRNKDIYKIGITKNLKQRFEQLKPDEVLNTVRCSNFEDLEKELHKNFKESRIPQTEYFRLTPSQVEEVYQLMASKAKF